VPIRRTSSKQNHSIRRGDNAYSFKTHNIIVPQYDLLLYFRSIHLLKGIAQGFVEADASRTAGLLLPHFRNTTGRTMYEMYTLRTQCRMVPKVVYERLTSLYGHCY
jgi:hypothetical protein